MPRGLKSHSNERIDLVDFRRASKDYADERNAFEAKATMLSRRSRFVEGFRIEVSDQDTNPGEISVFNGLAFDRDGVLLANEDQVNDSRTVTLTGASLYFYLELEYVEDDADPDARAFWDAVYDNPSPDPDGREFTLTVPTRLAPNWRIVTPVSTTGFEATTNPDSTRVPLAILHTDSSNKINGPGSITYVTPASVLEQDVSAGASQIRVLNSRLFPDSGNTVIDFGSGAPETVAITNNDRANGLLTFTPALSSDHRAGAIVRVSGTARFIQENTDPNAVAVVGSSANTTDARRRLFQGDERRGAAVAQSKETYGSRDDLNIESQKDYYDFVAAHFRDLRWGTMRPDDNSKAPPTSFSNPRYFDHAGGIMGARTATITIGDGTTSWGDLNGTTHAVFQSAVDALPSSGGIIFVKRGTYTFGTSVSVGKPVFFVGEGSASTVIEKDNVAQAFNVVLSSSDMVAGFESMTIGLAGGASTSAVLTLGTSTVVLNDVVFNGAVQTTAAQYTRIHANRCHFENTSDIDTLGAVVVTSGSQLEYSTFNACVFEAATTSSTQRAFDAGGSTDSLTFNSCRFADGYYGLYVSSAYALKLSDCTVIGDTCALHIDGAQDVKVSRCYFSLSNNTQMYAVRVTSNLLNAAFSECLFADSWSTTGTATAPNAFIYFDGTGIFGVSISNCQFLNQSPGTRYVAGVFLTTCDASNMALRISGCDFRRCMGVIDQNPQADSKYVITSCNFYGEGYDKIPYGIYSTGTQDIQYVISQCAFQELEDSAGISVAISLNTSANMAAAISDCLIDGTAATLAAGITVAANDAEASYNISNCIIRNIVGETAAYGIAAVPTGGTTPAIRVSNCHLDNISTTSSGEAIGFYAPSCNNSSLTGNRILNIAGVSASRCVWLNGATSVTLTGNVLEDQLYVEGVLTRVNIQDNTLRVNTNLGSAGVIRALYTDGSSGLNISGNTITTPDTFAVGVEITGATSTAELYNLRVAGNLVIFGSAGGAGVWYSIGESVNTVISDNEVRETATAATSRGIYVSSATSAGHKNLVVTGNTIHWVTKTANKQHAVHIVNAQAAVVSNNVVNYGAGAYTGSCFYLDMFYGTVTSNVCMGSGTSAAILIVHASSVAMVSGNLVNDSLASADGRISLNGTGYASNHSNVGAVGSNGAFGHNVA